MSKIGKLTASVAAATLGLGFYAVPASAQATRTWVSGVGDDLNPCSRTAPCKTFAGAISKTATGGEINCLDPGAFGAVTIGKAMSIVCQYTEAGALATLGSNDITVNAPAGDAVYLSGLDLQGAGTGLNGVRFIGGASLTISNSIIRNFGAVNGNGILFAPSGTSRLTVINTTIANNTNGIEIAPTGAGGNARITLTDVRVVHNAGNGIRLNSQGTTNPAGVQGTIDRVEVSSNGQGIIMLSSGATANAVAMITNSDVSNNTTFGIQSNGAAARGRVGNTTITLNGTGVNFINGADMPTYGNNRLNGNTADGAFTLPALQQQ